MNKVVITVGLTCYCLLIIFGFRGIAIGSDIYWLEHELEQEFDGANDVYAVDLTGEGWVDILAVAFSDGEISWWENDGNRNFTKHILTTDYPGAYSVHAFDMDNDDDMDIIATGGYLNRIAWWENMGDLNFEEHIVTNDFSGATSVHAVDLDGDGDADILGASFWEHNIAWWENQGNQKFIQHLVAERFYAAHHVNDADIDSDGDIDILGVSHGKAPEFAGSIAWWENDGNQNFSQHTIAKNYWGGKEAVAIDLDGDNDMDIVSAAYWANDVSWWENDGSQIFTRHVIDSSEASHSVYAIDIDNDLDIDLLGTGRTTHRMFLWENDGHQNFTKKIFAEGFVAAQSVHAIDLDGDDDIDVLGAAYHGDKITWWENREPPPCSCVVNMIPDSYPIKVAQGDSFGLIVTAGNSSQEPIVSNVTIRVAVDSSFMIALNLPGIALEPRQAYIYQHVQMIPVDAAPGMYEYIAYCGEEPYADFTCDTAVFQFRVIEAPLADGAITWSAEPQRDVGDLRVWRDPLLADIPAEPIFSDAFPNPFNAVTTIVFGLPKAGTVTVSVYNLRGQMVDVLADGLWEAGFHAVRWDASRYSSGIYFYRLRWEDREITKRMTLLR